MPCNLRTDGKKEGAASLGMALQPSQLLGSGLREPNEDCPLSISLNQLLGSPQPFGWSLGLHPHQVPSIHTAMLQSGKVRCLGRSDQQDGSAFGDYLTQCACEKTPLERSGLRAQQLAQTPTGPASAGQFAVERGPPAFDDLAHGVADITATPNGSSNS